MKKDNTHMVYGSVTAVAAIIIGLVLHFTGLSFESWVQWLVYAVLLTGLILNGAAFSKAHDANVTFGQVFSSCFKAVAIFTLISIAWALISLMIFPDMMEKGMEIAQQKMEEKQMSEEQIAQAMEWTKKYFRAFMVGGILFGYMFAGAICSLIAAAITKKNPKAAPPAQMQ
ncbi:MAG: DUF4199 domain-containing protein [Sphingobacteriales bacterium]|nr:MAG: DUF4199 domain-containing protein [Sphingobacteriales bacterium]